MPPAAARRARVPDASADKRAAILKAATRTFARRGYFQSQVADIARAAGIAAGTVYLYFRSKDDLLVSIFERTMKEAMEEGKAAIAGVQDARERLRRIARLHLERMGRDRDLAVVFQVELRQSTKFMERSPPPTSEAISASSVTRLPTARPPALCAATSILRSLPRRCLARSTRWPPTGF